MVQQNLQSRISRYFRELRPDDASTFLGSIRANRNFLLPWVTTPTRILSLDDAEEELSIQLPDGTYRRYGAFENQELVASVKLIPLSRSKYEIGIWCVERVAGQGLGVELILQTIAWRRMLEDQPKFIIGHDVGNLRSQRMIEKLCTRPLSVDQHLTERTTLYYEILEQPD